MRYFIEIAYKGTNYHGWQFQPNAITVQELINKAFSLIFKQTLSRPLIINQETDMKVKTNVRAGFGGWEAR